MADQHESWKKWTGEWKEKCVEPLKKAIILTLASRDQFNSLVELNATKMWWLRKLSQWRECSKKVGTLTEGIVENSIELTLLLLERADQVRTMGGVTGSEPYAAAVEQACAAMTHQASWMRNELMAIQQDLMARLGIRLAWLSVSLAVVAIGITVWLGFFPNGVPE